MSETFYAAFENMPYPCYFLSREGEFHCNTFAQNLTEPTAESVRGLLAEILRGKAEAPREAFLPPMLTDALRLQGLTVAPSRLGLLAFSLHPSEAPIYALTAQLRDPLSNIFSALQMLSRRLEDEDLVYAESIHGNCYALLRTARNLETVARVEKRNAYKTVDLDALVSALCSAAEAVCRDQAIPIRWETPGHPVLVACDPHQITEALLNLLRNAIQYTRDGNHIFIRLSRTGKRALLMVEDHGLGIKPEFLPRVFDAYFSADPYGDNTLRPGLGLGLAVVREVARGIGGSVAAESRFGEGTSVSLSLPVIKSGGEIFTSVPADYLNNRYSAVYVQLSGLCRLPAVHEPISPW